MAGIGNLSWTIATAENKRTRYSLCERTLQNATRTDPSFYPYRTYLVEVDEVPDSGTCAWLQAQPSSPPACI